MINVLNRLIGMKYVIFIVKCDLYFKINFLLKIFLRGSFAGRNDNQEKQKESLASERAENSPGIGG